MAEKIETRAGILARVDGLGRVTIPKPMRARMGLQDRSQVLIIGNSDSITIRTYAPRDDLAASIDVLEAQVEEMRYSVDVPSEVVMQMSDMISDMRELLQNADLHSLVKGLGAAQPAKESQSKDSEN